MGEGTLPGGGYTVPLELSAMWLDMVRSKTVCVAAGSGTVPMRPKPSESQRSSVTSRRIPAGARGDPGERCHVWRYRSSCAPVGCYRSVIYRASVGLTDRQRHDRRYPRGVDGRDSRLGDAQRDRRCRREQRPSPRGILNWPGIGAIAVGAAPTDYDPWLDAIHLIDVANLNANAVVDHPNTVNPLASSRPASASRTRLAIRPSWTRRASNSRIATRSFSS